MGIRRETRGKDGKGRGSYGLPRRRRRLARTGRSNAHVIPRAASAARGNPWYKRGMRIAAPPPAARKDDPSSAPCESAQLFDLAARTYALAGVPRQCGASGTPPPTARNDTEREIRIAAPSAARNDGGGLMQPSFRGLRQQPVGIRNRRRAADCHVTSVRTGSSQ